MTQYGSDKVWFLVDGYNLTSYANEMPGGIEIAAVTEDTTTFGDTWREHTFVNLRRGATGIKGFYDDATNASNAALCEKDTASRVICAGIEGNTAAKGFVGFSGAMQTNYNRIATIGELHKCEATFEASGQMEEGTIIHALAARTTAGNTDTAEVDGGAASNNGGAMYLQVTALTLGGYDSVTWTLRHSEDGETFADKTAFTARTAIGAERKTLTGDIYQYASVSWAWAGSGTGQTCTALVGLVRNVNTA